MERRLGPIGPKGVVAVFDIERKYYSRNLYSVFFLDNNEISITP